MECPISLADFAPDASSSADVQSAISAMVAVWALVECLGLDGVTLFDVQWTTPHLVSLGAVNVARSEYLRRLRAAI